MLPILCRQPKEQIVAGGTVCNIIFFNQKVKIKKNIFENKTRKNAIVVIIFDSKSIWMPTRGQKRENAIVDGFDY